jgi:hypothetical protein
MDDNEMELYSLTSYFFSVIVDRYLKSKEIEQNQIKGGVLNNIDFRGILNNYDSIHPLVLETRESLFSLPERSGIYKILLFSLEDSIKLFMKLLEEKIFFLNKLYKKSLGEPFSFSEYRKSIKTSDKLQKKMAKQLYNLELKFNLFINEFKE